MSIKKGSVTIASSVPTTEWGSIEGTLSDQTDLQNALNSKAPTLSPTLTGIPTVPTAAQGTNTNQIASTKFVKTEINEAIQNIDALPDQTGQSGKFLTTNGIDASWGNIPAELPSQTGQAGKVLTTNGTTASWTEYQSAPATDNETIHLNSSNELEVIGTIEKNAGDVKYDWIGTYAEWVDGRNNSTIPDDWICYITDDFVSSTVTHNIGDIFYSLRTDTMFNGAVACDGTQYDIANYSEGTQSLKSLLDAGKLPYVSIQTFDATVTANGSCRCFGYDGSEATVFKVPKLNDVFIESGIAANNSEFIEAGLPNIISNLTKTTGLGAIIPTSISNVSATGAFKVSGDITDSKINYSQNSGIGIATLEFDASNSNSIYGNSDTVQPNAVKYRAFIQLANASSESALQTVSTVVNDVNDLKEEMPKTLKYKNIANCLLEIPQDIKLELNNGVLTLKAGSKVYVPNGVGVFDTVTIASDMQISPSSYASLKHILCVLPNNTIQLLTLDTQQYSGSTPPSGQQYMFWYDTANNYVKYTDDSGSTWQSGWCLPLAIVMIANGTGVTSIDQVFNGFGYIGSTIFALPGVKGLIPNGRNEDGSLKNINCNITGVRVYNFNSTSGTSDRYICLGGSSHDGLSVSAGISSGTTYYDENENWFHPNDTDYTIRWMNAGKITIDTGKITSIEPKTSFHALDLNDKKTISSWSMPSNKYVDLTLGASGSTYTAPANGFVAFNKYATGANQNVNISCNKFNSLSWSHAGSINIFAWLPVKKGDVFTVTYTAAGTDAQNNYFRFIYAQGEI